ncbi:MAG: Lrp/AsnC ligand binding domain-containing protein [Candidatus Thorarchaeota archaeon]|jgi:DNA-binding Lrp family transcriptional regulator
MAVRAYVLMEIEVGKTREVVNAIRDVKGVLSVDAVTGPYDAIAIVEGETLDEIGNLVTAGFHLIGGISRTVICIAVVV